MKLDQFEKMIRKIVREEIEYSMEKLISSKPVGYSPQSNNKSVKNESVLTDFAKSMREQYEEPSQIEGFDEAPDYLKEALTRDYSSLVKRFTK